MQHSKTTKNTTEKGARATGISRESPSHKRCGRFQETDGCPRTRAMFNKPNTDEGDETRGQCVTMATHVERHVGHIHINQAKINHVIRKLNSTLSEGYEVVYGQEGTLLPKDRKAHILKTGTGEKVPDILIKIEVTIRAKNIRLSKSPGSTPPIEDSEEM